nr:immunoglobulin heavy chain junction region [Mus musculus]
CSRSHGSLLDFW